CVREGELGMYYFDYW
nr:immunoglobulin heavy chain junction region [Macaca mulatta]MOW47090.1 immunoglobulin heavy chain junction region [Macaca mulatta]MOW49637.1 immunoglobulin heavy chain junction region [Macaca mulatta]MOW50157.1 immunoglobulin heavy chain junction region [Macaca mulatta]MOW50446.1 immunoglobulin heavy chain junction region [Macaca mulatta]